MPLVFILASGVAWAYWSAGSVPGGNGASAATVVNQGATPTASATGSVVTVSWAASTLANGDPVDGYIVKRYDDATVTLQTILTACTGTVAAVTCAESDVPSGLWVYSVTPVFATSWSGAESLKSTAVTVSSAETTPPVNAISLSVVTGNAAKSGNTIFYRGVADGSFTLTNALTDADSGPASSATATLGGTSTGWTHSPSTVSTPAAGPYVSTPFSWTAGSTSSPTEVVTGRDVANNAAATTLTFVDDSTAPTPGTITYAAGYQTGRSVAVTFTTGTDSGSGLATRQLQRSSAPLTSGSCGTYGSFANVGPSSPTSPYTDNSVTNGVCYKYQYVVTDLVGNQNIATSANVAMVDYAGAVNATAGLLSHWRLGESTTSYDTFTDSTDTPLTSHTGELGATWVHQYGGAATKNSSSDRMYRHTLGYSIDYTTATPPSPDYSVEADLYVSSPNLAGDMAGVIGRLDTDTTTFYMARWEQASASWNLIKYADGDVTYLARLTGQTTLTDAATYRVRLTMIGTALTLYVNDVLKVSATDATLTSAGKAGIMDGADLGTAKTSSTGIHFDNFRVTPPAADSKGSNTGAYLNRPTLGVTGAIPGDSNTATDFDGSNDYVQAVGTTGIPVGTSQRSVEMWFKTGGGSREVLYSYGQLANTQEFGLWLDSSGNTMTAWGSASDLTFTLPSAVDDNAWHHVVETYDGTSITLYIDGFALPPQTATRLTAMDSYGFGIGAVIVPGDANSGGYFNGSIDEVSLYTTVLNQATVSNHYQFADLTGPTGVSVAASGLVGTSSRYSTSTTLSLDLVQGTDINGIAATGNQLLRASATLTSSNGTNNGSCGSYGAYTLVTGGMDPASPKSDTVADQACYRYQYVVLDTFGNSTTYTMGSSSEIKVDLTAPPAGPSLSFDNFTNTYWGGAGTPVYYRTAAATGSFRAVAAGSDTASGILSSGYGFPTSLGTNWSTSGTTTTRTYSWSGTPAEPGATSVTATNNATLTSPSTPFTFTADDTAPTASTISYADGISTGTGFSVSFTTGTDSGSGIGTRLLQRASATLTGSTCGTFGAFATRATNPASPYVDSVSATTCYMYQYLVSDHVGNAAATATSANVVKVEYTGPTGGSVAATGLVGTGTLYSTSTTLSLNLVQGSDPSGIATTGNELRRATATLTSGGTANGVCGSFGAYALVSGGMDPASPKSDTVTDQACYRYQYVVSDTLGNPTTFTSGDVKVDTTAPAAPSMTFGTFTNTYWSSGSTVFYRSAAASGSFRATAAATDTGSGIVSYGFPALGTNWTSTPVSTGVNTYSWTVSPPAAGTSSVTSTNNATDVSAGEPFTLTADDTAPTAGSVTYLNGTTNASVSVDFTTGTDDGSGIGTRLLQRQEATLTGDITCGTYGGWTTRATNQASPYVDSVTNAKCYKYQYLVSDNVGNAATVATSANIVKVETAGPTGGSVAATGLVGTGTLYSTSTTLSLNLAQGTDPNGVATTGNQLLRATATLTSAGTANGICGTYGSYALVSGGTDPASPKSDTVTDQACYKYHYLVSDTLGNVTTNTTGDIKVDTTAPPAGPALSFDTFTNTYWSGTGSTVFYRSAATSGTFRAVATGSDTASGILSYAYPALGTNWTSSGTTTKTYSWAVSPAAAGTHSVTSTNNANLASAGTSFTLTADDTAPTAGSVTYLDGFTNASVSVDFTTGTDGGSGIGTRLLQRQEATLTGGITCGTYGAFATRVTNPASSPYLDTVTNGKCYKYQYLVSDNVGNAATVATSANIVKVETAGPTGGSVAATGLVGTGTLYSTSTTVNLNLAQGTDPNGVATTGNQLLRATATLTTGTCGTYGTYALVTGGTDPASPKADTVTDQACYKYQYVVSDTVGNPTTYATTDIKVDTTASAAPFLSFSTFTNTYWSGTGSTVFYRSAAASGSFRATAAGVDNSSGIVSYAFPGLGTNWTSTPVSLGVNTYAWTVSPPAAGTSSVTANNNAALTSPSTSFTLTADDTAPTAGTVTYLDGTTTSTSVGVTFTGGTDGGSGVGTRTLQRASATLSGTNTCGTYGAFATRGTNPTSPYVDAVTGGSCYMYQYVVTDNVGNAHTATSASVVKVDTTGPTGGSVAATGLVGTGTLYSTSTTLSLNLVQGTDPNGIATTGNQLLRATATLTSAGTANGACGTYGTYALVTGGTDPASPKSDTVTDQACYKYQYLVSDTLGNVATNTSTDIKVDTTAPAAGPSLTFGTFTNTYWSSGSTVFYRSAAASGSFRATAAGSDTGSGILSYGFPALGTNWTSTPFSTTVNTYAWTVSPPAAGTSSVTATNNASLTSAGTPFTLTADDTAPSAGTVTYADGTTADTSVSVSFTAGTDAGSGVATGLLQRASAPLTGGVTCGTYTAYTTVTNGTNPTSPLVEEVSGGTCYKYQYVVTDNVGNADTATSTNVIKVTILSYFDTISGNSGLVNYWRLGETDTTSDTFTGTAGVTLQSRAGEIGATWTTHALSTTDAVITAAGRIRKTGTTTLGALYSSSGVPASADYTVGADVHQASNLTNDALGVVGRMDPAVSTGTYYAAEYKKGSGSWELYSMSAGTKAALGSYSQTLSTGTTYRLDLDMTGSTIRLLVNGVQRVSVTNTTVTAAGSAGVTLGFGAAGTTLSDTTGLHLENFKVSPLLADSEGTNTGDYLGGATLAQTGAIAGDSNTAVQFDGVNDYGTVLRQISDDFSIEFWFKSTQGIGTSSSWYNGAGLVDAEVSGTVGDFGVSLRSDGKVVAGTGGGYDTSIVSTNGGYNNGAWHHVVFTRTNSSGALKLYVDGVAAGTATGDNAVSLTSPANINFGRIQTGVNYFLGSLDEVAVYNAVLSGPAVTTHYNAAQ